ncbi:chemotaxis protein CheW [Candidatus Haliotispira prima]|uniref:Chemotaxis protein CheW n=1 Tax=Candidatus Haliotispira prima TaxID=3034016 RepID=A0ABY8MFM4_9SPIO|nr:chemotaxis protein CheW [Candidatus Haliotispira prima]
MSRMAGEQVQLVTFQLGSEYYGIDTQYVKEIHGVEAVRAMPNTPNYIEGILNLRREVIPIISLHKRFGIMPAQLSEEECLLSGFIILKISQVLVGIVIDKVDRVIRYNKSEVQPPPQIISGISGEYVHGVVHEDQHYLILLDIISLFGKDEFMKHIMRLSEKNAL